MVLSYLRPVHKGRGGGGQNSVIAGKLILIEDIFYCYFRSLLEGRF